MPSKRSESWTDALLAAGIGVVVFLAYLPAFATGFTADDFFILAKLRDAGGLQRPLAYFQSGFFEYYRPLAFLSFAVDWTLWGQSAAAFHATNVGLHVINAVLVYFGARALADRTVALAAALLFGLHPASHEAVFWIASRFDLLATALTLAALLCIWRASARSYWAGVLCFALALLCKESALSLPIITTAHDVLIARRNWQTTIWRLAPLLGVLVIYAVLRSLAMDVPVAGGARRVPKLVMIALALGGLLWLAKRRASGREPPDSDSSMTVVGSGFSPTAGRTRVRTGLAGALASAALLLATVFWAPTSAWMREKLGFVAYATFYLVSPIVLPVPPPYFLDRTTALYAVAGVFAIVALFAGSGWLRRWLGNDTLAWFLAVFVVAALLPVSSMTGGTRYLYLASVGVSILGGVLYRSVVRLGRGKAALAGLVAVLVLSWTQIVLAGRIWRWASDMTRDGLALMASDLQPCGTKEVVLLTAPVGIGGVYSNFYWDAFGVTSGCPPANFLTLLRVVRQDARVDIVRRSDDDLELRVPGYRGNFVASSDLRLFDRPVRETRLQSLDTPLGHLDAQADGNVQIFRLRLNERARQAKVYYYSEGRVQALPLR